jgi:hypothetical protein
VNRGSTVYVFTSTVPSRDPGEEPSVVTRGDAP